jgi:hypothetical protein
VRTLELGVRRNPELPVIRGRLLFAYATVGRWGDVKQFRAQLRRPGGDDSGAALPALADLVLGDREPMVRLLTTRAGQRRWFDMFAGSGCNPLVDPLWSDQRFRAAMRDLGISPCPLARPWPFPPRTETTSPPAR